MGGRAGPGRGGTRVAPSPCSGHYQTLLQARRKGDGNPAPINPRPFSNRPCDIFSAPPGYSLLLCKPRRNIPKRRGGSGAAPSPLPGLRPHVFVPVGSVFGDTDRVSPAVPGVELTPAVGALLPQPAPSPTAGFAGGCEQREAAKGSSLTFGLLRGEKS